MGNFTEGVLDYNFNANKYRIKRIVIFTAVALVTFFGNTLILTSLRRFSKRLKGTPYVLIGNLAVADLLLAIGLTFQLTEYIFISLDSNMYFCVVKVCLLSVSLVASGKLLLLMSLDRFCAIVFPMKHMLHSSNRSRRTIKIAVAWIVSVLFGCIPTVVHASLSQINNPCAYGELKPRVTSLIAVVLVPLQFVVNIVLCLIVIWKLRTSSLSRQKYKKSVIKCGLLIKVYVVFALCWTPFVIITFLTETSSQKAKYMAIREYAAIPALLNSAMNWIIYGSANKKLRKAFNDVFFCRTERDLKHADYIQPVCTTHKNKQNSRQQFLAKSTDCETSAKQKETEITITKCN